MAKTPPSLWLATPEEHDYPAAASYLSLIFDDGDVEAMVRRLRKAEMAAFKAKDIFRASRLPMLGDANSHVVKNTKKMWKGQRLSPLLLVRDSKSRAVIIADGYHRMCAVYLTDEDAVIPCKIV